MVMSGLGERKIYLNSFCAHCTLFLGHHVKNTIVPIFVLYCSNYFLQTKIVLFKKKIFFDNFTRRLEIQLTHIHKITKNFKEFQKVNNKLASKVKKKYS